VKLISGHSYQDFFALWKNAEPDIAILKQAKAEYARLQRLLPEGTILGRQRDYTLACDSGRVTGNPEVDFRIADQQLISAAECE